MKKLLFVIKKLLEYIKLAVFIPIFLISMLFLMLINKLQGKDASLTAIIRQVIGIDESNEDEPLKPISEIYIKRETIVVHNRPPKDGFERSQSFSARRVRLDNISNFTEYLEIGRLLNLSDRQARIFAGIALDFTRKELIEISQSRSSSIDGMKRDMAKKLGFSKYRGKVRDRKIKEFAKAYIKTDYKNILSLSSKKIDEDKRILIAEKQQEEFEEIYRIYRTAMENPHILEEINRINPPE